MDWFSAGVLVNPVTNTVLAETNELLGPSGANFTFFLSCNSTVLVFLEELDGTKQMLKSQGIYYQAGNPPIVFTFPMNWPDTRYFRVRLQGNLTGQIQVSILRE